jgi:protein SCO1/2
MRRLVRALGVLTQLALAAPALAGGTQLLDVPLVDAQGVTHGFARDAIGQGVAVINPIWTGCSSLCPLTSAVMGDLAARLGPRLGGEVRLVSLAIDSLEVPKAQLARWLEDYGQVPGWLWLGGAPGAVETALAGLGMAFTGGLDEHPPVFLVVDGQTGRVLRFDNPVTDTDLLLAAIARLGGE